MITTKALLQHRHHPNELCFLCLLIHSTHILVLNTPALPRPRTGAEGQCERNRSAGSTHRSRSFSKKSCAKQLRSGYNEPKKKITPSPAEKFTRG
jgi:hypothetical protein